MEESARRPKGASRIGKAAEGSAVETEFLRSVVSKLEEDVILGRLHPR
jgi:hypothetical protein